MSTEIHRTERAAIFFFLKLLKKEREISTCGTSVHHSIGVIKQNHFDEGEKSHFFKFR